jgi:hypothetical protein
VQRAGLDRASVVSTASIVAIAGASIAAPLAMPPTDVRAARESRVRAPCGTVSVVMIACAAACRPRVGAQLRAELRDAGSTGPSASGCR